MKRLSLFEYLWTLHRFIRFHDAMLWVSGWKVKCNSLACFEWLNTSANLFENRQKQLQSGNPKHDWRNRGIFKAQESFKSHQFRIFHIKVSRQRGISSPWLRIIHFCHVFFSRFVFIANICSSVPCSSHTSHTFSHFQPSRQIQSIT